MVLKGCRYGVVYHKGPYWVVKMSLYNDRAFADMYIIELTSIHTGIQKVLNKSGRTTGNSSKKDIAQIPNTQRLLCQGLK